MKPGLADSAAQLEKQLLKSYRQLAVDVLESLRGASDDIASGRLAQVKKDAAVSEAEEDAALDYYNLPESERSHVIDHTRLAAILALILIWRRRHTAIAEDAIHALFDKGHQKALSDTGQPSQMPVDTIRTVRDRVLTLYGADLDRLETGLRDGTARAHGVEWIVQNALTIGVAATLLRQLMTSEQHRVEMFAESLTWRAWSDGYRVGAVDATQSALKDAGVTITSTLSVDDLDNETKAQIPAWLWSGPDDERACGPCSAQFGNPVYALGIDDLPAPEDICLFGRACRHFWSLEDG